MKVWLEFDTIGELKVYKEENKHRGWKFLEEYEKNNHYILVVEKSYDKINNKYIEN